MIAAAVVWLLLPWYAASQPSEYDVKAAYLLNFTRFIEWPPSAFADPSAPFNICIAGKDPLGAALEDLVKDESVDTHKISVRRISENPGSKACQIVFFPESTRIAAGIGRGVLIVGEGSQSLREGAMVAFLVENRRVRFDIRPKAAEDAMLKVSSKLLSVARSVVK
jgi:hypothetical protein